MDNIKELVDRVINGDTQAFEIIYQNTYRQVYCTCMSFLKNEQNVYDIMQDTYITALTHLQQLENPERITAWLNTIAVNKCKNFMRKRVPAQMDETMEQGLLEDNDNFLPESYVIHAEKRKIILDIMQEELSAVQYQTIIMYYFDGMSVSEIAACMECPEGTVEYRLSAARGKIKAGVQEYEDTSGIKLYSSGGIALLTAIFMEETKNLAIPNVLTGIFAAAKTVGAAAVGTAAVQTVGTAAVQTAAQTVGTAAEVAQSTGAVAAVAGKAGLRGLFKTVKAKIIAGIAATAVVAGGAAGVILHNHNTEASKSYTEINTVLCDNEYLTITADRIYDIGYVPDEDDEVTYGIKANQWSKNDSVVAYTVVNHKDYDVYYDLRFNTFNNESEPDSYYTLGADTIMMQPNQTCRYITNNHIHSQDDYDAGREPVTWAKVSIVIRTLDNDGMMNIVYNDTSDKYFYGENKTVNYKKTNYDDREQVMLDNDQIKMTFVGALIYDEPEKNYYSAYPYFYLENKTDHDLRVVISGDYIDRYGNSELMLYAGTTGYIIDCDLYDKSIDDENAAMEKLKEMINADSAFDVSVKIYDYTAAVGGYIDEAVYREKYGLGVSIYDALDGYTNTYNSSFKVYEYEINK